MYFCNKCDSLYTINQKNNDINDNKVGGDKKLSLNEIITKSLNKKLKKEEIDKSLLINIKKSSEFQKLKSNEQEYILNNINDLLENKKIKYNSSNLKALFLCKNCGNTEKIKERTCIFTRREDYLSKDKYLDPKMVVKSNIIFKTTNFICPNTNCKNKKDEIKTASFFRTKGYKTKYICNTCLISWYN
jgi:hypothetical protein